MLSTRRPLGLGQASPQHSQSSNQGLHVKQNLRWTRCLPRATERDRLDALVAATAVALLVEAASPTQLSGWGIAPRAAFGAEGGAAVIVADAPAAAKRPPQLLGAADTLPAVTPAPPAAAPVPTVAAQAGNGGGMGIFGLFARNPGDAAPKAPAAAAANAAQQQEAPISEPISPQPKPQPTVTVAVAGPRSEPASGRQGADKAASTARGGGSAGDGKEDEAGQQRGSNSQRNTKATAGPGEERAADGSLLVWALERAALVVVGGVAGVAVVRNLSSPAARAIDVDSAVAVAAATAASRTSPTSATGLSPPAGPQTPAVGPQPGPQARAPYAGYDKDAVRYGSEYGTQWDEAPRSGSGGRRRVPGWSPSPVGPPPAAGRWPRPGSPTGGPAGRAWPPGPGGPTYMDAAADYDKYEGPLPPAGPYYGALPPPPAWWRGPYADYERYGAYDGPYGQPTPPPYRGYAWDSEGRSSDSDSGTAPAGEPQDLYYYYSASPPPGPYWGRTRWGQRQPYDTYEAPYGMYDGPSQATPPPLPPQQPGRGFAGMRTSPGARLGRNPWASVEQREREELQQPAAYGGGARSAAASSLRLPPEPINRAAPGSGAMELEDLQEMDAALAQLQAQIDELQGVGTGGASPAAAAAAAFGYEPSTGKDGSKNKGVKSGEVRPAARRTVIRDWRQQLQEEEGLRERQRQQRQWRQVDEQEQADAREEEGRLQQLYDEDQAAAQVAEEARVRGATSVSPEADQEYERLLKMWRQAHGDEREQERGAEAAASGVVAAAASGRATRRRPRQLPSAAAAALPAQRLSDGNASERDTGRRDSDDDDDLPHPPPVMKRGGPALVAAASGSAVDTKVDAGAGMGDGAVSVPAAQPVAAASPPRPQQERPSAPAPSLGGPVGWLARMFQGFKAVSSGGRDSGRGDNSVKADNPPGKQLQPQPLSPLPLSAEQSGGPARREEESTQPQAQQHQQVDEPSWEALHVLERQAEEYAEQQQKREELQAEAEARAEQAQAGAALAAAVEAALQGQLAGQQAAASATAATAVAPQAADPGAGAAREEAASPPRPPPPAAAAAAAPAPGRAPAGTQSPVSGPPSKESIQQLKATSAAAADRAAETLARIRAMRAAAQAGGLVVWPRSGSGNRAGGASDSGSRRSGGATGGSSSNSNGNGNGKGNVGSGGEAERRGGALAAEIAASHATQSDVMTEAPGADRAIDGSMREAAEVH